MNKVVKLSDFKNSGFIKTVKPGKTILQSSEKIALIRKGNEMFNSGKYDIARRIFMTTGYSDGLIRMGDYYMKNKNHVEALKMYWLAPAPRQFEQISERTAIIISNWLKEEEKSL
jgi:hypothetical protein